ncbi:hypothetical protein CIPAW_14G000400 [Carya illinoinensis]|uniref:Uncharacterized protein n=1 Tax=Carya illinoinensis TaxID=32201 RepID=A0A8T1N940_CARIL|nr:hypothetical protein CIPAW_14G000400 [Carya illinoinensis]
MKQVNGTRSKNKSRSTSPSGRTAPSTHFHSGALPQRLTFRKSMGAPICKLTAEVEEPMVSCPPRLILGILRDFFFYQGGSGYAKSIMFQRLK